jgi:hypothetical protein
MTINDPKMSHDITQRVVPIMINPPATYAADWRSSVQDLIESRRYEIFAEIQQILKGEFLGDTNRMKWSRWADWEKEVLGRVCDPSQVTASISERKAEMDDDTSVRDIIREIVVNAIKEKFGQTMNVEMLWVSIPTEVLADMVRKECPYPSKTTNNVLKWLTMLRVPGFIKSRDNKRKTWQWKGKEASGREPGAWEYVPM